MKKLIAAIVTVGLAMVGFAIPLHAVTPPDSCFAFNVGTGAITDYYDNEANNGANPACTRDVDIPSTIGGTPVTAIGSSAFNNTNNQLTSLTIPSSVTSIGASAFRSNLLVNVTIPNSVTTIGSTAFQSNQLTSLTIPSSVTSIGTAAFQSNQLTSVTIPSSVTSIGSAAFASNQLTSLTIPSSVTTIGTSAFANNQLTNLTIPSTVTSIGSYTFGSNQLTSVTIQNAAATMHHQSFIDNPLASMTIGASTYTEQSPTTDVACFAMSALTVIDYYRNSPLIARDNGVLCGRDATIAGNVTGIGNNAFSGNQLASVIIPISVTSIGISAFSGNHLTSVTIPTSVTNIGNDAFRDNRLTSVTIPSSVTSIGNYTFESNQLTSVTIPSSVTSIGYGAFHANRLISVTIPNSVTSIGHGAFALQSQYGRDLDLGFAGVPDMYSDDPVEVQKAYDAIWYARLITEDPSNPNGLVNDVLYEDWWTGDDGNANSINDSLGGHLINPASLQLQYVNQSDASLQTTQTFTGFLNSAYLNNYLVTLGPAIPVPADPRNPTLLEQQAIDDALAAYYRIGDEVTITPPAIDGYNTPPTQTFVLGAATNEFSYVYAAQSSSASGGELAETGMSIVHVTGFAIVAMIVGVVSWFMTKRQRGIKI